MVLAISCLLIGNGIHQCSSVVHPGCQMGHPAPCQKQLWKFDEEHPHGPGVMTGSITFSHRSQKSYTMPSGAPWECQNREPGCSTALFHTFPRPITQTESLSISVTSESQLISPSGSMLKHLQRAADLTEVGSFISHSFAVLLDLNLQWTFTISSQLSSLRKANCSQLAQLGPQLERTASSKECYGWKLPLLDLLLQTIAHNMSKKHMKKQHASKCT